MVTLMYCLFRQLKMQERSYNIQKLLYEGGMHKSVNLAMQSMSATALKEIKRDNISLNDYKDLQKDLSLMEFQLTPI